MAKTRKVNKKKNDKLRNKLNHNTKNEKKTNLNCVVILDNIDHLLHQYNIPTKSKQTTKQNPKEFEINFQIKNNQLIVHTFGQPKISVEATKENDFHLEIQIRNDRIKFMSPNNCKSGDVTQLGCDLMEIESMEIQPQRITKKCSAITTVQPSGKFPRAKTLYELTNDAWKRCKNIFHNQNIALEEGQYVMTKMRSFSPWPAKINGFSKNKKKVYVYFYGTNNSGTVEIKETIPFQKSDEVIRMQLLRHLQCFAKGIREVETELGISAEMSITNEHALTNN